MNIRPRFCVALLGSLTLLALLTTGCSSTPAHTGSGPAADKLAAQQQARSSAEQSLERLYAVHPDARREIQQAAGYAVFRTFGLKVLVAGGGSGHGIAVDNQTRQETYMRMVEIQAGLGFGAKTLDLVWVFKTPAAFKRFVSEGIEVGGQATLAAKVDGSGGGVSGAVEVSDDVWVYQLTDTGLAAELTVKGTRYYPDGKLN